MKKRAVLLRAPAATKPSCAVGGALPAKLYRQAWGGGRRLEQLAGRTTGRCSSTTGDCLFSQYTFYKTRRWPAAGCGTCAAAKGLATMATAYLRGPPAAPPALGRSGAGSQRWTAPILSLVGPRAADTTRDVYKRPQPRWRKRPDALTLVKGGAEAISESLCLTGCCAGCWRSWWKNAGAAIPYSFARQRLHPGSPRAAADGMRPRVPSPGLPAVQDDPCPWRYMVHTVANTKRAHPL